MKDVGLFPYLENMLTLAAKRQQAISANLANMDTPGYRAKDFKFEETLNELRMVDVKTPVRPDGNNVDLERELTELTKNGVNYVVLVQYLNQKLRTLRSAINEGGQG